MADARPNQDLEDAMSGADRLNGELDRVHRKKKKRSKSTVIPNDHARRYAYKVMALLSGLDERSRAKVLAAAGRINEA